MITFNEIKTLLGTEDFKEYCRIIDKIDSLEVAKAIIYLLIDQKELSALRGRIIIDNPKKRECIKEALYQVNQKELERTLFDYEAYDVLKVYDEEKKNNDNESN